MLNGNWKLLKGCKNYLGKSQFGRFLNTAQTKLTENEAEEIQIPVPWGHIAGKWWGDKNVSPIIAIHGWQDNANSFDKLIPLLNVSSVIAIDLPGHGCSSHLPEGSTYDFGEYIILLHRVVKYFKWTKLSFLTHSFGGALGYTYSSIFPNEIKCLISFECARALLTLHRQDISTALGKSIDASLKIEKLKKESSKPAYKLSQMVKMCMKGSMGSVCFPESALVLLKRGILAADESSVKFHKANSTSTDLIDFIEYEQLATKSFSEEEKQRVNEVYSKLFKSLQKVNEDTENFHLEEAVDKHYVFKRDPLIKVQSFQGFDEDYLIEASKRIKCPVLSLRAKNGFLNGATKHLYEKTLDILKTNCSYLEHHEVDGSHHAHLNNPESLAPIINNFLQKVQY